jgi:transcription elongation factor Elf1
MKKDRIYAIGMVCLDDLLTCKGEKIIDKLGIKHKTPNKKKPAECLECGSTTIAGIFVLGGKDGVMLWQCEDCGELYLKYTKITTEKWLNIASKYWTNKLDWIDFPNQGDIN